MGEDPRLARGLRDQLRLHWAGLIVVGLAAAGYFFELGSKSLWFDEAFTAAFAALPWDQLRTTMQFGDGQFAAYYALLHPWTAAFGNSEFALRALTVVAAVFALAATYALGNQLFGRWTAALGTAVLASNPLFISLARDARPYTLAIACTTLSSVLFMRASAEERPRVWIAYVVAAAAAAYAHLFAVLVVVAHAGYALAMPHRRSLRRFALSLAAVALIVAPLARVVFGGDLSHLDWIPRTTPAVVLRMLTALAGSPLIAGIDCLLLALAVLAAIKSRRETDAFAWACLIVPLAVAITLSSVRPMLIPRYFAIVIPFLALLVARGLFAVQFVPARLSTAALLIAVQVVSPGVGAVSVEDWRGAVKVVTANATRSDLMVAYPAEVAVPVMYYLSPQDGGLGAHLFYPALNPIGAAPLPFAYIDFSERVRSQRLWLFLRADELRAASAVVNQLAQSYELRERLTFAGVLVLLWTPRT